MHWVEKTKYRTKDIGNGKENEDSLVRLNREIERKQELQVFYEKINKEIARAADLYSVFFPKVFPDVGKISFAVYYKPAENIGGDFYNIMRVGNQLILYMVDVMGHGMESALINIFIRETLNSYISQQKREKEPLISPSGALSFLSSQYSKQNFPYDYLVSIFFGILDLKSGNFAFSSAGHHIPPILSFPAGRCLFLHPEGLPLSSAIEQSLMLFPEKKISFLPGSTLLFTTDGIVEEDRSGEIYGEKRLCHVFAGSPFLPPEIIINAINQDYWKFRGQPGGHDDISFLVMQYTPPSKNLFSYISKTEIFNLEFLKRKIKKIIDPYLQGSSGLIKAFHEIAVNAIIHGNKYNPEKDIQVEIFLHDRCLYLTVEDEGEGFDWYKKVSPESDLGLTTNGGGIARAKVYLDHLSYNEKGNKAFLVKKRN